MSAPDFPWERDAAAQKPMPDGLTLADQMAFQAVSHLYARYALQQVSREQASVEKKAIRSAWEKRKSLDDFDRKLTQHHAAQTLRIESHIREFRKAETAAAAVEAAREIISIMDGIPAEIPRAVLEEMANAEEKS